MSFKKVAAAAVVGLVLPILVDVAADPYADRGLVATWLCGAAELGLAGTFGWALDELVRDRPRDDRTRERSALS